MFSKNKALPISLDFLLLKLNNTTTNISPSQQQKPPQPLPRTSLGKSPLKSSPEISSVQSKIHSLENAILMNSRSNTPINLNLSTQCMPSTTPVIKNRHSDEFYSTDIYGGISSSI